MLCQVIVILPIAAQLTRMWNRIKLAPRDGGEGSGLPVPLAEHGWLVPFRLAHVQAEKIVVEKQVGMVVKRSN